MSSAKASNETRKQHELVAAPGAEINAAVEMVVSLERRRVFDSELLAITIVDSLASADVFRQECITGFLIPVTHKINNAIINWFDVGDRAICSNSDA